MSDFDERLAAVLTAEADDAPPAAGLARGARQRHVVRRRRHWAIGGVAVVLVVAAPVAVLAVGRGGGAEPTTASDTTTPAGPGWQTVGRDDVSVEIPAGWAKYTCDFDGFTSEVYGPTRADACDFGTYLAFYASATFDPAYGPGVISTGPSVASTSWGGYVYAGDFAVSTSTDDRALTRLILASARLDGQPRVEATDWTAGVRDGVSYEAPEGWGVDAEKDDGYGVQAIEGEPIDGSLESEDQLDPQHFRLRHQLPHVLVTIVAPTQAIAELVAATTAIAKDGSDDPTGDFPCDPGFGDPKPRAGCPDSDPDVGTVALDAAGQVAFAPRAGQSPVVLDLDAVDVCTGVIVVGYQEPLEDHVVGCGEFRAALDGDRGPIRAAIWRDDTGAIVQLSELYHP